MFEEEPSSIKQRAPVTYLASSFSPHPTTASLDDEEETREGMMT
jgi:hypothetical protein